jgi:hypothetical protein
MNNGKIISVQKSCSFRNKNPLALQLVPTTGYGDSVKLPAIPSIGNRILVSRSAEYHGYVKSVFRNKPGKMVDDCADLFPITDIANFYR